MGRGGSTVRTESIKKGVKRRAGWIGSRADPGATFVFQDGWTDDDGFNGIVRDRQHGRLTVGTPLGPRLGFPPTSELLELSTRPFSRWAPMRMPEMAKPVGATRNEREFMKSETRGTWRTALSRRAPIIRTKTLMTIEEYSPLARLLR